MSETFSSILERAPPQEDAVLNETLSHVVTKALGDSDFNRKQTANIFLKKNEKSNILAKTRSINYNLMQIRNWLSRNMNPVVKSPKIKKNENNNVENPINEKVYRKKIKSLMLSNELWGNRHYQQVIEDSFLMPKLDLNTAKQQSFYLKELTSKYSSIYQKIHNSELKRKALLGFLNDSFQGVISKKIETKEFLSKRGSMSFLKSFKPRASKQAIIKMSRGSSSSFTEPKSRSELSPKTPGLLERIVKDTIILGQCQDTHSKQKAKEAFFRQMIDKNIGNDNLSAMEIEKAREIRNKLVSTYHYAKHKRGKNPFSMLVTGKKQDKQGIIKEVLQKTEKKILAKTFHFMTPLDRNQEDKKQEEKPKDPIEKEITRTASVQSKKSDSYLGRDNTNIDNNIKKRTKHKPVSKTRNLNANELKQVSGIIMKECEIIMKDDLHLKREIGVGLNLKELESYVESKPELKEARLLREIKKYEREVQLKNEGFRRSTSENIIKN